MRDGYSGECRFTFSVERVKGQDGTLYTEDEDYPEDGEVITIELDVLGSGYYVAARVSGPWEDCSPSEGDEDIISVTDSKGDDWFSHLTDREISDILEKVGEEICQNETGFRSMFN